jgi:predicted chitinase
MQEINRDKFLFIYEQAEFGTLTPAAQTGLLALLGFLEADAAVTDLRHAAYMLATTLHETGGTYEPVAEDGKGAGHPYGQPDPVSGERYYGRGFVQLTWAGNFKTMGEVCGVDLYRQPDLAMEPAIAYRIMSYGMRNGSFTGVGLAHYISGEKCDFLNARRIINGTDCADRIAGYAVKILDALEQSVV